MSAQHIKMLLGFADSGVERLLFGRHLFGSWLTSIDAATSMIVGC
jgi:hypothetical protein